MNATPLVQRDERTVAVENASYRWAYLFLSFGLLVSVAFRSLVHQQTPWDLLLLVVLAGGIGTAFQGRHGVLSRGWGIASIIGVLIAAVLGVVIVLMRP